MFQSGIMKNFLAAIISHFYLDIEYRVYQINVIKFSVKSEDFVSL